MARNKIKIFEISKHINIIILLELLHDISCINEDTYISLPQFLKTNHFEY